MAFSPLDPLDHAFSVLVQGLHAPALTAALLAFNALGHPGTWFVVSSLLYWKGRHRQSFALAALTVFTALATGPLKFFTNRPRPFEAGFVKIEDFLPSTGAAGGLDRSFPSGHAALAAAVYAYFKDRAPFPALAAGGALAVALVALARVYLGMHYLTDVVAGGALGYAIGRLAKKPIAWLKKEEMVITRFHPVYAGLLFFIAAGLLVNFLDVPAQSMALAGYFTGFLAFRELRLPEKPAPLPRFALRAAAGGAGLALLAGPPTLGFLEGLPAQAALFAAGVWVTLAYPLLYTKSLKAL